VAELDELSILEAPGSDAESPRLWLGGAFAAVLLVLLTMVVLAILVFVIWGASLLVTWFGVPHGPSPLA
jgi:hypothetical protein